MIESAVAERYARAVFELAVEAGQLKGVTDELQALANVYASSTDLQRVLENPLVDQAQREAILRDLSARLSLSPVAVNTVRLLVARRRVRALPEIAKRLVGLADEKAGLLRATVTSAIPLSETYYQNLASELEKLTGKKILLERKQDPSLIAGVVTRVGDNTIDGSLRGQLSALERKLLEPTY
jgi:F-type H+-transporting ATPase subunit delta